MYAPKRAQYVSKACALKSLRSTNKEHTNRSFFDSSACFCKSEDRATERCGSLEVATRRETVLKGLAPAGLCLCPSCTKRRSAWYDKYFAYALSRFSGQYEEVLVPYKQKLFNALQSDQSVGILEIGVGTGLNFEFYKNKAPRAHVFGLDPNPEMKAYAQDSAAESLLSNFEFVEGYAEQLPFEDGSFDYAVVTQVLCSVPDVEGALREIRRVLKPHGQFLFLEHVIGPPGSVTRLAQTVFNPVQQIIADGCHLTRDTLKTINSSSFKEVRAEEILIPEASFLAPHILGSAFQDCPECRSDMVLVLCIGDFHVPHRSTNLPQRFKELLQPGKIHHILCTGNLCCRELLEYLRTVCGSIHYVKGDFDVIPGPEDKVITIEDFKIGLCHGHQVVPAGDKDALGVLVRRLDVDILLTGHTHVYQVVQHDDRLLMNPGSATGAYSIYTDDVVPSFMLMDITGSKVDVYIYQMIDGESKVNKMEFVKPQPRSYPKGPKDKFRSAVAKVMDSEVG